MPQKTAHSFDLESQRSLMWTVLLRSSESEEEGGRGRGELRARAGH